MNQICLGCSEECKMDAPHLMTGCPYEDSPYPKDAKIWCLDLLIIGDASKLYQKTIIKEQYPEAWAEEEHNEPRP